MKNKIILAIASFFGIGFVPLFPGTAVCFAGMGFVIFIKNQAIFFLITVFILILAFFISQKAEVILKRKDPKEIVIDDLAGLLVTFLFVPRSPLFMLAGFFLFRFFDIFKIPPANKLEAKKGSLAIVGDDLVAGIYANFSLQLLRLLLNIS